MHEYKGLTFNDATNWLELLNKYLDLTVREPRSIAAHQTVVWSVDHVPSGGRWRYSPDYNRYSPDYNRYLLEAFGTRLPWSTTNPPRRALVAAASVAAGAKVQVS